MRDDSATDSNSSAAGSWDSLRDQRVAALERGVVAREAEMVKLRDAAEGVEGAKRAAERDAAEERHARALSARDVVLRQTQSRLGSAA